MTLTEAKEYFYIKNWELIWKKSKGPRLIGKKAGNISRAGYEVVGFNGKKEFAHRVIWLLTKGYMPEGILDHIDRNKLNNDITNLREVSRACNMRNAGNWKTNTSGVRGVCFYRKTNNYRSQISLNNTNRFLYYGKSLEEAVMHRLSAEQCLGWKGCDKDSTALLKSRHILGRKETKE